MERSNEIRYQVKYSNDVLRQLKKLDKFVCRFIKAWIDKNLINTNNPRIYGKQLVGNVRNYWCYRIGDYRLICEIKDDELIILMISIGHRKEVYDKKV